VTSVRVGPRAAVPLLALAGALLRLPLVTKPLSSDEAGFLRVGGQWGHGSSLYGDYWVDRPPLLIGIFQAAESLGGAVPLRLAGILALVAATLVAGAIGRLATDWRWAAPLTAVVPAALMSNAMFGATEVDGELLAVPFVLAGVYLALRALAEVDPPRRRVLWWVLAGVTAVAAASIKQSMLEVFVAAGVGVLWLGLRREWVPAATAAVSFAAGAGAAGGAVLGWAAALGTRPGPLFDAVVTFRGQAAQVISAEASSATGERARALVVSFAGSGAWLLGVIAVLTAVLWWRQREGREPRHPVMPIGFVTAALMVWETFGVVGGGSYWLHYLIGTVPGSVLIAASVVRTHTLRVRWIALASACMFAVSAPATLANLVDDHVTSESQVAAYLRAHATPGQTAVTAFGQTNMLEGTGLEDPYEYLWSLPVRVRDPRLTVFTRVLRHDRPTWVVVPGPTIDTWAVDAARANVVLANHYRDVTQIDEWHVFRAVTPKASAR
jgi:hypothetical protein